MSSISSVSSVGNSYQPVNSNGSDPLMKSLRAVSSAVQSGNVADAQSALATFQKQLQGNSPASAHQPFGSNHQANSAYQSLVHSVQTGDLAGAQQAVSSLKTDLRTSQTPTSSPPSQTNAGQAVRASSRLRAGPAANVTSQTSSGQSTDELQGVNSALQSGNLLDALSALTSIQTSSFGSNGQANSAYQSLVTALQSGNSSAAQQAFAVLQAVLA